MKSKSLFLLTGIFSLACFLGTTQAAQTDSLPTNVNFEKVEAARLNWQNQERTKLDIPTYTGSDLLEKSAQARAETLKTKGTTTHKRLATDGYYNYRSIRSRFADQGVAFKNEEGTMFTESLGRGTYSCKKNDCTDIFIKAMRSTFNYFMREKSYNGPHYKAIVSTQFTSLGLGIAVSGKKFYLVSHYGKNVVKAKPIILAKTGK